MNYNDRFYGDDHIYEGIPIGGYTRIFEQLLENSEVKLEHDFFEDQKSIENLSDEFLLNVNQFILEYHENFNGEIWNVIKRFLDLGFKVKVKPGDDLNYKMGTIVFTK